MNKQSLLLRNRARLIFVICLVAIVAYVAIFGYLLEAWTGFPKGADAYARITRIVYILDFFPNVFWQYHWANGMPTFKTEAPLFYFLGAIIAKVFSLTPEQPLHIIGFLTFVMIGMGVFGYVLTLTKSFVAGLLSAILALSSFSLWSWMVAGGIYPRIFGVGLSTITLWQIVRFLEAAKKSLSFPRWSFVWASLTLALTIIAHALMGFFTCLAIFLIILLFPISFQKKIKYGFLIALTAFSLAGFFLLPLVVSFFGGAGATRFIGVISPVIPALLYYLYEFAGIGPFILPLLVILFVLVFFKARSFSDQEFSLFNLVFAPFLMLFLFSTYALIGYAGVPGKYYYINGFIPLSATLFMGLYGSIVVGLLFSRLEKISKRVLPLIGILLTILVALSSIFVGIPLIKNDGRQININNTGAKKFENDVYRLQQILKFPAEGDFNHRFAAYDAAEAVWFNTLYRIPQVRDYYGQGILYPDWRFWFEQAVWNQEEFSIDEARAAFDWFATRWFSTYESHHSIHDYEFYGPEAGISVEEFLNQSPNRYFHEPGFKLISHGRIHYSGIQEQFEIENPSSILSATNAPTILFIGNPKNYNLLFSNLTFGNYSSQKIIPLRGRKQLDSYQLAELNQYDVLLLYGYQYRNAKKVFKLLADYLSQGGNLVLEAWESPGALTKNENREILEPMPFSSLEQTQIEGGVWHFGIKPHQLTEGIDFDSFSPPLYNNTPWKITTGKTDSLRPWAQVLLSSGDDPLLVVGSYGQGKVIWTGFNFLYHINAYKNLEEAKFLYKILSWLAKPASKTQIVSQASFINPQEREITIENRARGVLFKESYYPNGRAYLVDTAGKRKNLKTQLAGPGMTYVFLGEGVNFPAKVVFQYKHSLIEKLGFLLSFLVLIGILGYGLRIGPLEKVVSRLTKRPVSVLKKTKSWWHDEEA